VVGAAATGEWCVTRMWMAAARVQALEAATAWSAARIFWRSGRLPQVVEVRWRPPDGVGVGVVVQGPDLGSLGPIWVPGPGAVRGCLPGGPDDLASGSVCWWSSAAVAVWLEVELSAFPRRAGS
jgi:hypothetical protein